jgi:hypothetical protein
MRHFLIVLCVAFPSAAWAACPLGSFPAFDNFGNQICKSFDTGATRSVQVPQGQCPRGAHRAVDERGNQICQSDAGGQRYYDTSKGCPNGFIPFPDQFGRMGCKRL